MVFGLRLLLFDDDEFRGVGLSRIQVFYGEHVEPAGYDLCVLCEQVPGVFSAGENIFPWVFAAKGTEPSDVLTVVCCIVYELVHQIAGWIEYGDAAAAWKVGEDQFSALLLKIASSFPGRSEVVWVGIGKGLSIAHVLIGLGARKDAEIIGEIARFQGL